MPLPTMHRTQLRGTESAAKHPEPLAPPANPCASPLLRFLWCMLAYVSFGIGVIAVFIPGLPTTEFILLAAYAASKGSPRFHAWLEQNRLFGTMIRNWRQTRAINRRAKISASVAMSACLIIMSLTVPHRWLVVCAAIGMAAAACWIWSRPDGAVPT